MTKADLIERIYAQNNFSKKEAAHIVEELFELIKATLENGEMIKIPGFGNFIVMHKQARRGRNPQTGEKIEIAPRKILTFKPSPVLKRAINETSISAV